MGNVIYRVVNIVSTEKLGLEMRRKEVKKAAARRFSKARGCDVAPSHAVQSSLFLIPHQEKYMLVYIL